MTDENATDKTNQHIWKTIIQVITEIKNISSKQKALLSSSKLIEIVDDKFILATPNSYIQELIEIHFIDTICDIATAHMGKPTYVMVTIEPDLNYDVNINNTQEIKNSSWKNKTISINKTETAQTNYSSTTALERGWPLALDQHLNENWRYEYGNSFDVFEQPSMPFETGLNSNLTFDNLVVGESNAFAHSAAIVMSENPLTSYNPLFIYGASGLGKTHFLHAIGNQTLSIFPKKKVKYVNAEEFTNEFISAIRSKDNEHSQAFHRRYRYVDLLLLDDVQFFEKKKQTLEEFFHTFNTLFGANKIIVVTGSVHPSQLIGIDNKMKSRLQSGLIVDILPPEIEMKIAFLQQKIDSENILISKSVLEKIAIQPIESIRELEGLFVQIVASASIFKTEITPAYVDVIFKKNMVDKQTYNISLSLIVEVTVNYFGLDTKSVLGTSRKKDIVLARQISMYLARALTKNSYVDIGNFFTRRDHTTVIHANKKIKQLLLENNTIHTAISTIRHIILDAVSKKHA